MTVNRVKKHNYLGMTLDYYRERAFQVTMFQNLKPISETFEKNDTKAKVTKMSAVPANFFTVK